MGGSRCIILILEFSGQGREKVWTLNSRSIVKGYDEISCNFIVRMTKEIANGMLMY